MNKIRAAVLKSGGTAAPGSGGTAVRILVILKTRRTPENCRTLEFAGVLEEPLSNAGAVKKTTKKGILLSDRLVFYSKQMETSAAQERFSLGTSEKQREL